MRIDSTLPVNAPSWQPTAAARATSFDSEVRGRNPQAIDQTFAALSQDVYQRESVGVGEWRRLDASALERAGLSAADLEDPATGLRAALYQDGQGNHVLAFAGSGDLPDWLNNLQQGIGLDSAQYRQAVSLAKDAKLAFGDDLAITGHSLGGGLATAAALATGSPAVTFNAAGLTDRTIEGLGLDPAAARGDAEAGQVRRYTVDGEVLTTLQEHAPLLHHALPDALGRRIALDAPALDTPQGGWLDLLRGDGLRERIEYGLDLASRPLTLHKMDAVREALAAEAPWSH